MQISSNRGSYLSFLKQKNAQSDDSSAEKSSSQSSVNRQKVNQTDVKLAESSLKENSNSSEAESVDNGTAVDTGSTPKPTASSPKDDLYKAYWTMYQKDYEQTNVNTDPNSFARVSQMSYDNSKKIITSETDAKAHIQTFMDKLIEELKNSGNYTTEMQDAIKYVQDNFRWDLYFEDNPNKNANTLELKYLQAIAAYLANDIASKYLISPQEDKYYRK